MSSYNIKIKLKSQSKFKNPDNLQQIKFDVPSEGLILNATVDTTPEGTDNPINQRLQKNITTNFIPLACSIFITSSFSKIPKGAGKSLEEYEPVWRNSYGINIQNNSIQDTKISNLKFRMNNGIRFLALYHTSGPQGYEFLYGSRVNYPSGQEVDYTEIYWTDKVLSKGSLNKISIQVAIWDRYIGENGQQNAGEKIPNNTPINTIVTMTNELGIIQAFNTIKAIDIAIFKLIAGIYYRNVAKRKTNDIFFKINYYDSIISTSSQQYKIIYIIPNGEFTPSSITKQGDGSTTD